MNQYVIIVVPSKEVIKRVDLYREKYAKNTNYVIDPHFTVYPPFTIPSDNEDEVVDTLKDGLAGMDRKTIRFDKVGYFEGKNNVAFFEPDIESTDYLKNILVKVTECIGGKVKNVYDDYNFTPEKFKPHMTIAERIPDDNFIEVKKELDGLNEYGEFKVSSIFVYKHEPETNRWQSLREIGFEP